MSNFEERENQWLAEKRNKSIEDFPKVFQKFLIENLNIKEVSEKDWVEGSFIYGPNGTGKTTMAIYMLLQEAKMSYIYRHGGFKIAFITTSELLLKFRETYTKNSDISEKEILDTYSNVDLLVLDDFGVEKTTDWSYQMLYILINRRYENMKKTIITSNFTLEQLAEKLGDDRIPSRIQGMCKMIQMTGTDRRAKK